MRHAAFRFLSCMMLAFPISGSLSAQIADGIIVLDANTQRQVISAYSQDQTINLNNLKKGETYDFIVPLDVALGSCLPEISLIKPTAELLDYDAARHSLRFKATATIAQIQLNYPCSWDASNPPRHYVSIVCQSCGYEKVKNNQADMSVLEVENAGAEALIRDVLFGGDCFDVKNVTFSGAGYQIGKFSHGQSNIGYSSGMIMATGDINIAPGPNDQDNAGSGSGGGSDSDLAAIATGPLYNVAVVEFDFTPMQTPFTFNYAFASEEYCEYVNSNYNDVFGFFISGPGITGVQNLAVVPSTNTPISVNTINHITNSGLYMHNTPAGLNNCENGGVSGSLPPVPPATGPATQELQYDGFTKNMVGVAQVIPCSTYHVKLAIADVGDAILNSGVFLKEGSFDGGGNASINWVVNGDPNLGQVIEGCGNVQILVKRVGSNPQVPQAVSYLITGTATSGADFSPIPQTIVIAAGQDQVLFPVNIINDLIPEGAETIILTLNSPCSCLHPQEILTIVDPGLTVTLPNISINPGGNATLTPAITGGTLPYSYHWSTNSTNISITTGTAGIYTITVTDGCGQTAVAAAILDVNLPDTICSYTTGQFINDGFWADLPLTVHGATNPILGLSNQGLCGVHVHFDHEYVGDLKMILTAPGGHSITLIGPVSYSGNTDGSTWDITFVPCNTQNNPDSGFVAIWSNNQAWGIFNNYAGTYYPHSGCLQDFTGPVNGDWTLTVIDSQAQDFGIFYNYDLVFCDPSGINCAFCGGSQVPPSVYDTKFIHSSRREWNIDADRNWKSPSVSVRLEHRRHYGFYFRQPDRRVYPYGDGLLWTNCHCFGYGLHIQSRHRLP
jgi:subtilisin-like proprotein convertase family protein